jgi:hypothetical protein
MGMMVPIMGIVNNSIQDVNFERCLVRHGLRLETINVGSFDSIQVFKYEERSEVQDGLIHRLTILETNDVDSINCF